MKFFTIALLLIPPAFAQMTNLLCVPPPASLPPATAASQGRGPGTPRTPPQQSAADVAEIARLTSLPPWGQNLADGDYSNGPAYPTAPELSLIHISEPTRLGMISYAVFCLKKK